MKTRISLLVVGLALVALVLIVGPGLDLLVGRSSPGAAADPAVAPVAAEYQDFSFASENINQSLREYEALKALESLDYSFTSENINQQLRDYEALKAAEYQDFSFASENINQRLRDYESLERPDQTGPELDEETLRQMRFNLPEGTQ
ncbi:MAG: hypothetical protein R3335_13700 [Anaerolineales bacterium]|nr:hypothetical protein [Anaerolineales bacterium]